MQRFRPELGRSSTARTATALVAGALTATLLSACDSVVGIPGEEAPVAVTSITPTTSAAAPSIAVGEPAPTRATTSTLPPVPTDAPQVGAVPGNAAAAPAVRRWANDLANGVDLQDKCWSIPPRTVTDTADNAQSVLAALTQPGTVSGENVVWRNRSVTVVVDQRSIASGYACGRSFAAGVEPGYDDADARHTVRRYLARATGKPLDATDIEATYPLTCAATTTTWDPEGTGNPTAPPLARDSGKVGNVTSFVEQELRSDHIRGSYLAVQVPVSTATGAAKTRTFTLAPTTMGYCIGDVTV
ncbi:hypothetical protein [Nocardia camponoti]|uniref:Sensor domain-containing protein n=1 Tax=Nocardia camponoti TaxID=1616106 RepID=A0A917VAV1_9NOCA|nr:hypothetical protein [Nocardia camponoti]GGK55381.1 hypothetical protein GCM10011591_29180 [Nocardia camponoti]